LDTDRSDFETQPAMVKPTGVVNPDKKVTWARTRKVPRSFPTKRFLALFVLTFVPPITRWKIWRWGFLPGIAALGWLITWYVSSHVTGTDEADNEVRWAADISLGLIFFVGLFFPSGLSEDREHRSDLFRVGTVQRAVIIRSVYGVGQTGRWIPIRLETIRRVRYLFGVAAIQLPNKAYLLVPSELFLSPSDWTKIRQRLASREAGESEVGDRHAS
jgi:hypothetical protein